jgi:PIN domain nuclease of toxin-antitoxin system
MKLLLDTHALLWAIGKSDELPERIIHEINNPALKGGVCCSPEVVALRSLILF